MQLLTWLEMVLQVVNIGLVRHYIALACVHQTLTYIRFVRRKTWLIVLSRVYSIRVVIR